MALAAFFARAAERDALIQRDVIADFARFADNHAHGMVDEETTADLRGGVNFHARHKTGELARNARQTFQPWFHSQCSTTWLQRACSPDT